MKKILFIVFLLCLSRSSWTYCQKALVSSVFESKAEFGSMSVSVGEAFCSISNASTESKNNFQMGVQQTDFLFLIEKNEVVNEMILYPNPAVSKVNIDLTTNKVELTDYNYVIYSLDGKKCLEGIVQNKVSNSIDVSLLSEGKYIFSIQELPNQNIHFIRID